MFIKILIDALNLYLDDFFSPHITYTSIVSCIDFSYLSYLCYAIFETGM